MSLFEKNAEEGKSYVGMLDSNGDLVAFITPVKGVSPELIVKALEAKGVSAEVRESKADRVDLEL